MLQVKFGDIPEIQDSHVADSSHSKQHYLGGDQSVIEGSSSGLCWIRVWWETSSY